MRVIFNTASTEKKDKEESERYRQDEARQRAEDARREDLADEKGLWSAVLQTRLEQSMGMDQSVREADKALKEYRERFQ